MPTISLPTPGLTPGTGWATQLNVAINAINNEVDGRLGTAQLSETILKEVVPDGEISPVTRVFDVTAFGARGVGTDDTAAIQSAIDAMRANTSVGVSGGTLFFPPGEFVITAPLNLYRFSGTIKGSGLGTTPNYTLNPGNGTVIRWAGSNTEPMLYLRDYRVVLIQDLRLEGRTASRPTYGIQSDWKVGDSIGTNESLIVDRVRIGDWPWSTQGVNVSKVQAGIGFTGDNGNNDQFVIRDTHVMGCAVGADLPNTQSIWGQFENFHVGTATTAGIRTAAAIDGFNLTFDNCAIDIQSVSTAAITVHGWYSERSAKIFQAASGSISRLVVFGGKWLLQSGSISAGANFLEHPLVTAEAGVMLYGVEIITTLSPHPKLYLRGTGGGATGGTLLMSGCRTTMSTGDFDVASTGSNVLDVDIRTPTLDIHQRYTSATTLTSGQNRPVLSTDATDLTSAIALVNNLKSRLISSGQYS